MTGVIFPASMSSFKTTRRSPGLSRRGRDAGGTNGEVTISLRSPSTALEDPCQRRIPQAVSTELWLGEHGLTHTVADATGVDADTARERVIAGIGGFATGRFTTPQEVATPHRAALLQRTANVTGANYIIDGGLIKTT